MNGDVVEISVMSHDTANQFINTFHYMDRSSAIGTDTDLLAVDFLTLWLPLWQAVVTDDCQIYKVYVQGLAGPVINAVSTHQVFPEQPGGVAGPGFTSDVAISVKRSTGLKGPKNRGRIFVAPFDPSLLADQELGKVVPNNADLHAMATFISTPSVMAGGINWTPVLFQHGVGVNPNAIIRGAYGLTTVNRKSRRLRFPV
jgi:hypothetical protein